ncbi:pentapeptide repeat-containing protein, partial [Rhodococcus hoagii]|nr:pentapeptide repeat-containing protein [Prescottella equi]
MTTLSTDLLDLLRSDVVAWNARRDQLPDAPDLHGLDL